MARTIDERIAKLTLENKDFEQKANRTFSLFSKLTSMFGKASNLNLDKSVRSVDNLNNSTSKISLSKLLDGARSATSSFSALGVMGVTALMNITNRAVDAGIQLAKSFVTKPIMDGFNEYELKMKSIQTIMSNTQGKNTLQDVTGVLDELNTYADKTIYNFAEMTSNIGTFTAAGVGLEDSATAIKGIANLAAASGSNSQQASTAMYQLSQAIATGSVKLQDWNSVVNAGMGGKLFQNALLETADNMGIANTGAQNFRESLQEGWLTTDVLLATLQRFSEDQSMLEAATKVRTFTQLVDTAGEALGSGWAQTWEIILGDFEEAGELWTKANDAISVPIQKSADARNKLLQDFVDLGGKKAIVSSIANAFQGLSTILGTAKKGFQSVIPPITSQQLLKFAQGIEDLSKKLIPNEKQLSQIKDVAAGFGASLSIAGKVVKMFTNFIKAMIPPGIGDGFLDLVARLGRWLVGVNEGLESNKLLSSSFTSVSDTVQTLAEFIGTAFDFIKRAVKNTTGVIKEVLTTLSPVFTAIMDGVKDLFGAFDVGDLMTGGLIGFIVLAVKKVTSLSDGIGDIFDKIKDVVGNFGDSIDVFSKLGDTFEAWSQNIKADTIMKIGIAVGVLAVSLKLLSTIPIADLSKSLIALGVTMFAMTAALSAISKMDGGIKTALYATTVLPALALSVLAMAGALKVLSGIDPESLTRSIAALAALFAILATTVITISKFGGKLNTSAASLLALSASVLILSHAVDKLGQINTGDLVKGVVALGAIMLELAAFMLIVKGSRLSPATAIAVAGISASILIIVEGIRQIAALPVATIQKGLITIGLILLELGLFVKLTSGSKVMSAAVGMNLIALAISQLVPEIQKLGEMSYETLAKGLGALAITLGEVVLAMRLAQGGLAGSVGILLTAAAINVLVPAVQALGNLSWEQIAKGLVVLAGAFTIIAIGANAIGVVGSVGLFAFAAAITALGIAAVAVAVAITTFVTAINLLAAMTDETVRNIGSALQGLGEELLRLIPLLVQLIVTLVVSLASGIAEAAPQLWQAGADLLLGFLTVVEENIQPLIETGANIIINLMNGIGQKAPELVDAGINLVIDLVNGMAAAISENSEEFVQAGRAMIGAFLIVIVDGLVAVLDTLLGWIPGFSSTAKDAGQAAKDGIKERFNVPDMKDIGKKGSKGFVDGIDSNKGSSKNSGKGLASSAKAGANTVNLNPEGRKNASEYIKEINNKNGASRSSGHKLSESAKSGASSTTMGGVGGKFGSEYVGGINGKTYSARSSGRGLASGAKGGAESVSARSSGAWFGEGFASGIESKSGRVSSASSWLANVGKKALEGFLAIFSPSRVMRADGGHFGEGFALGIQDKNKRVEAVSVGLASKAKDAVSGISDTINDVLNGNLDFNPNIIPTIDTSNMKLPELEQIANIITRGRNIAVDSGIGQNGDKVATQNHYTIQVNVEDDDLTYSKAKRFAETIQDILKQDNEAELNAIGEGGLG